MTKMVAGAWMRGELRYRVEKKLTPGLVSGLL